MPNPLDPPATPGRIIIPGAGTEPEPTTKPRIVLPPGFAREEVADVPERPKLRPLVLVPFSDGKRELLLVNDPLGVIQGQPVLGAETVGLLQLMDGSLSMTEIGTVVMRESKDIRVLNMVKEFVAKLDEMLMLDSPRFEKAYRELRDAYHALEIRPAALEGRSYPPARAELAQFLDGHVAAAVAMREQAGEPAAGASALPRAILAPHLDPRRAGATIARAFLEVGIEQKGSLRVVVFGTGHSLFGDLFALTRKHLETPLGKVSCDTAFVDAVASKLGDAAYRSELAHREEHSIEFQAIYLKHRFGERPITIVPILCGGFHTLLEDGQAPRQNAEFEAMIAAVREAERSLGGPTLYVAGVDFSHVGARFGDPPIDDGVKQEIEAKDREAIEAARRGDAEAWYSVIAAHEDSTRICGWAPTYALLRCAEPGEGRLLHYEQSEEEGGSTVSMAAMVWG